MYKRLYCFLLKPDILFKYQFGFRAGNTTALAIIKIVDKIRDFLDREENLIELYFDLSKAFDTVNHDILLYKLSYYGIRGHVLQWFRSYLNQRKQKVYVNGVYSGYESTLTGVP